MTTWLDAMRRRTDGRRGSFARIGDAMGGAWLAAEEA
jgi:hypothetical protein